MSTLSRPNSATVNNIGIDIGIADIFWLRNIGKYRYFLFIDYAEAAYKD